MAVKLKSLALSRREIDVLCGIVCGKTYQHIADDIGVSRETVKSYADRLRDKTGAGTKVTLALWAATRIRRRTLTCGQC